MAIETINSLWKPLPLVEKLSFPLRKLASLRAIKALESVDPNGVEILSIHRDTISKNTLLRRIYKGWYLEFARALKETEMLDGLAVELGSGAGIIEEFYPSVVKTDVVKHSYVDQVADAMKLPFSPNSIRAIFMLGILHHLYDPKEFFLQVNRVLQVGGRLVMIEPSGSIVHQWMTNLFNPNEYFDRSITDWKNQSSHRISNANNAIPSVIFQRDKSKFESLFPSLRVSHIRYHTVLSYYASGGLSYNPFLPKMCHPLLWSLEAILQPFADRLGSMMTIEIEKKS